ncbi:putative 5'(3')-deoxyribonucleotidase, HAD-like domain-containing protein [Rosa chinensis]|uniref:Putative 5'(3')-deoxyribonucleotidase, HAD-like domain-containing protein n=1 Tax=Rosa chinensis TaxID=74649 RepID=A0A2P6RRE8_ROSCH|nr:putative 5'(3')-deoxyribonucleotidase, HAD-like domain-containing protein [Rosa chinensis]
MTTTRYGTLRSEAEADTSVHEFFKTSYFKTGIQPLLGAQEALRKLSASCNMSVVTLRQNILKQQTFQWLEEHYPGLFQGIHFGNQYGAKVLIDDNPKYAIDSAKVGIRVVLLFDYENSYTWSKTESINQPPLITKVHKWEAVEKQLTGLIHKTSDPYY